MVEVKFIQLDKRAKLPQKNYPDAKTGDAAYDLFCYEKVVVPANGSIEVKAGLQIAYITPGYWFKIEGRSGLGFNHGISPHFGVVDNSYRGVLGVKLFNSTNIDHHIEVGKAVAQFIIFEMIPAEVSWTEEIEIGGERGSKGFGSSDKRENDR